MRSPTIWRNRNTVVDDHVGFETGANVEEEDKMSTAEERMKEAEARMRDAYAAKGVDFNQVSQKTQLQQQALAQKPELQQQGKVSGFFSKFFHKEEEEKPRTLSISGPENVKHEGFVRFDKQGGNFQTQNLPKEYQEIFNQVNTTLTTLGVSGITEKEAKLILKALPAIVNQSAQPAAKPRTESFAFAFPLNPWANYTSPPTEESFEVSEPKLVQGSAAANDMNQELLNMIKANEKTIAGLRGDKSELAKKLNELVKVNRDLNETNQQKTSEIDSLKSDLNRLRSGSAAPQILDSDIQAAVQGKTQVLQQENSNLKSKVSGLESQLEELKRQMEVQKDELSRLQMENKVLSPPPLAPGWDSDIPPPPQFTGGSVPPPPTTGIPPPPPISGVPPPPPTAHSLANQMGNVKLNSAPQKATPPPPKDDRSQLLNAIRGQNKLRHVSEEEKQSAKPEENNVASLIARALIERRNVIKNDETDDSADDNLEDWL